MHFWECLCRTGVPRPFDKVSMRMEPLLYITVSGVEPWDMNTKPCTKYSYKAKLLHSFLLDTSPDGVYILYIIGGISLSLCCCTPERRTISLAGLPRSCRNSGVRGRGCAIWRLIQV